MPVRKKSVWYDRLLWSVTIDRTVVGMTVLPLSACQDAERGFFMLIADEKNEFELDCRVRKLSERTIKNYRMLLSIWVRYEREIYKNDVMEQVTSSHVKNYILYLINDGKKPQYVNDNLKVLKVFFKYALEEGHIVRNPTERVHNVKQPKVLIRTFSEHEIRGMIEY